VVDDQQRAPADDALDLEPERAIVARVETARATWSRSAQRALDDALADLLQLEPMAARHEADRHRPRPSSGTPGDSIGGRRVHRLAHADEVPHRVGLPRSSSS
jgi:hypothetical protein